jgi:hypothetical protein
MARAKFMRTFILAGFFSLLVIIASGLSAIAADTPPSDAMIQQRIVGTWFMNWMILQRFTTITTNGDYVRYDVSNSVHSQTNRFEGTRVIKDGFMIDTLTRSGITNQPVPYVVTNVIIRLTDHELLFRAQNERQPIIWERVTQ